jgi:hypothetical protein
VDTSHYNRPGEVVVRDPESWRFVPLIGFPALPDDEPMDETDALDRPEQDDREGEDDG